MRLLGPETAVSLQHDSYYRDLTHLDRAERENVNFDHPESLETALLVEQIGTLLAGRSVEVPVYDYSTHTRTTQTVAVRPAPVIVVDGILVLADEELRALMDVRVFVDVPEAERLARRTRRDVRKRGRTEEMVHRDHERRVEPMHRSFVVPSRKYADVTITEGGRNQPAIEQLAERVWEMLRG